MSGSERQKAAKLLSRPGGWPRREGSTLLGRRAMETVLRREKSASRYSVMGAPREGGGAEEGGVDFGGAPGDADGLEARKIRLTVLGRGCPAGGGGGRTP